MHLAHQHFALVDRGLQACQFGCTLLGHVAGHQQQLRARAGRAAGPGFVQRRDAAVPYPHVGFAARPVHRLVAPLVLAGGGAGRGLGQPVAQRAGLRRGREVVQARALQTLQRPREEAGRGLVKLLHAQRAGIEQRDGQRRRFDDALQRSLGLRNAHLGLAPALDVQQRDRHLAPAGAVGGEHGAADDPELAPVARFQPALEGLGLAVLQAMQTVGLAQRVVGFGCGHDAHRLAHEVGQLAAEHAPRRTVHPLDALLGDSDDAHQHRVQHRARALGLAGQGLARTAPLVDVDEGADHRGLGLVLVHRAHRHLYPDQAAVAAAQAALTAEAALLAQRLADAGLEIDALAGVFVQLGGVQRAEFGAGPAGELGHGLVGALDACAALVDDAHFRKAEHQFAVAQQLLQFGLLVLEPGDVGKHGHRLGLFTCALGAAHRQGKPLRWPVAAGQGQLGFIGLTFVQRFQRRHGLARALQRTHAAREDLLQRGPGSRTGIEAQHALEAPVAAHQHRPAQVGDAGGGAVEDGRQLAQQLFVAALRALLVGDVQGHDRGRVAPARERTRLDAREQPARAQFRVAHGVAHFRALAAAQRLLQAFEFGQR